VSEGDFTHLRRRAFSIAAGACVVGLACALLVLSTRTTVFENPGPSIIQVVISPRREPPARDVEPRPMPRGRAAPPTSAETGTALDRAQLARTLACLQPRARRPAYCPPAAPGADAPHMQLPSGGDFYRPPEPDLNRIYTPAELDTLVMPPCPPGCIRVGPPPPPPSRSAEQICRDANMGGPCELPLFREEDVVRSRSD
jgi:hypothetical protein